MNDNSKVTSERRRDALWMRSFRVAVRYAKRETGRDKMNLRDERLFVEAYSRGFKAGLRSADRQRRQFTSLRLP